MDRDDVVAALHTGMGDAVRDFHAWTDGGSIEDWGVESLLTAACARALAEASRRTATGPILTLEQTFAGVVEYSRRWPGAGRPTKAAKAIKDKPTGRVDIVVWNRSGTPRAVIEIKRSDTIAGLKDDAERIAAFICTAGRLYEGSIRYGAVATLVHASTKGKRLKGKVRLRREAIGQIADKAGLRWRCDGPKPIHDPKEERDRSVWSLVFLLED